MIGHFMSSKFRFVFTYLFRTVSHCGTPSMKKKQRVGEKQSLSLFVLLQPKYRKYCAAAEYLKDTDWMLVLDDNTGKNEKSDRKKDMCTTY